ncbi:MAG: hypothetical protein LUD72_12940 [Bacteroidales bacterium]|nr:hypothetical protein [Bacteroidales bacterium]
MRLRTRTRTFHEFDGSDIRLVRVITQADPDRSRIRARVTYIGEEGGRRPHVELGLTHHADKMYELPFSLGLEAALAEGLRMWREDRK